MAGKKTSKNNASNRGKVLTKSFEGQKVTPLKLIDKSAGISGAIVAKLPDGKIAKKNGKFVNYQSLDTA